MPLRSRSVPALAIAFLLASRSIADIVITEIHYDPLDGAGAPQPNLEYVEIYNDGSEPYDLSGYRFTRGFTYVFPYPTFLGAQSYLAVCRDVAAATSFYGISNAAGGFTQALDNGGETIELSNPQGAAVSSVSYNNRGRWPAGANGTGHSLSIRTPYSDPSDPDSWTLSVRFGGTPGADNAGGASPPQTAPILINEGYTRDGGSGTRFIELYNSSVDEVDLGGYFLSDDFGDLTKYAIPESTTIPGRGLLAFTEAETGLDFSFVPVTRERISVALTNPPASRVVDAVAFQPAVEGKSEARIPDGDRELQPAAEPTPGAANASQVITAVIFNEIMYNPLSGDEADEFIELHNRGETAVDLSSWRVEGVGLTFPADTSIPAGGYLVLARDPVAIRGIYGLPDDAVHPSPWQGALRDGGERIELIDPSGNVADAVSYKDGGDWPLWPDKGSSLELIDPASDNSVGGSWDASDDSAKAVTTAVSYGPVPFGGGESDFGMMLAEPGIAIIDDITLVRSGASTNLIQNGTFESSTSPWRIEGTHIRSGRTTNPAEILNGSGSLKLISWNGGGDYKVNRIEEDTATQTSGLHLVSFSARWVVGSPRIITIGDYNVSQPSNAGLAGSNAMTVPRALGTPGAQNSVTVRQVARTGASNVGPAIDRVSHSPGVPQGNEQVTVTARVRDPNGVTSVSIFHRTETPIGAFTEASLSDPDGDGVYTGAIPGQALGTRILYYVQAIDDQGTASRFPTDHFQRTHPPIVDPAAAQPNDYRYCMYRHDTRVVPTNDHSYRFILNQPSQDYLRTRRVHSNEMVDGTFVFGPGDVYYNSQIRFAGSPFLRRSNTFDNSYSIRMPKDRPLHGRKEAFNLDQHGSDGRERIAHYLLRQSAAHTALPYYNFQTLVRFQLNDVKIATFEALDKPNDEYISFWFPDADDGPFFEMDDRFGFNDSGNRTGNADGRLQYPPYGTPGGENRENYRWFFGPRANESADDFTAFQQLCRVLDEGVTPNAEFDTAIWNHLDVEEVLRVFAVQMNIDDWDTWGGRRGKNCYFYQSSADGLWRLVPWDLELTYGNTSAFPLPTSPTGTHGNFFAEVQRMMNRPRIKRMYYGILAEQVNTRTGFFRSGFLAPYLQQLSAAGVGRTDVGMPGGFIDSRAAMIRGWIQGSIYPQTRLAITTRGGADFATSASTVDLAGNAPADVFFLAVFRNGESLDPAPEIAFSTTDMTGWTISAIPIGPGVNTIEVIGLGSNGIVDEDSIKIASSADWNAPAITEVYPTAARPGETVTILGSDFHAWLEVYFGSTRAASVTFDETADPTRITAAVPMGAPAGETTLTVRNADDRESGPATFTVVPLPIFIRGDGNQDGGVDLSDALKTLFHLFAGLPVPCRDALDANDSGSVDLTDAIVILDHVFKEGPAPAAPYPASGPDTTADGLDCEEGVTAP